MERRAARATFEAFGAEGWAEQVDRLLAGPTAPAPATTGDEATAGDEAPARFTCDGDTRTVTYGGRTVLVHDLKGCRYLARLLAEPGRELHVLDLVAVEHGTLPVGPHGSGDDVAGDAGAGLPVLDDEAREAYRRRLAEVDEDIDDATRLHDLGRLELAQRDRDYLITELSRAVGLGGRARTVGGTAERARTSVTRSIRYSIGRLAEHHPELAAHLDQAVRTGTYCSYTPDPRLPIAWQV
jgi:hypothetical protein